MAPQPTSSPSTNDQILQRLTAVELDLAVIKSNYATKEDIARLEHMIAAGDSKLEQSTAARHSKLEQATAASHSNLEVKMAQLEARLIKWFIGTAVTLSAAVGAIAFSIARFIH